MHRARGAAALALLIVALARPAAAATADDRLRALGNEYVSRWMDRDTHEATDRAMDDADGELRAVSGTTLAEDKARLLDLRARLEAIPAAELSEERAIERLLLAARIERRLLDAEVLRPFERDPGAYLALIAGSVESVLESRAATSCRRLRLAAQRLAQVPEVLRAARINLRDPPRELTEIAIDRYAGVLRFYREGVRALAAGCRDARTQADLAQADTAAVRATEDFLAYLRESLLPVSRGTLAIGPEGCRRLLRAQLCEEAETDAPAVEQPIDSMLAVARRLVDERRATLETLAAGAAVDGAREALDALTAERPEAAELVPYVERRLGIVREFLRRHEVVSLPRRDLLRVREAKALRGLLSLTELEAAAEPATPRTQAWLELTPPDSAWDEGRRQVHLARFDRHSAELAAMHDGLPGLYLRGLALAGQRARTRRALQGEWTAEEWAEYCETMMIEEGYGEGDPGYRVAAAARALRFAGRSYAALALHCGAMSVDQARTMLEDRCLLDPDDAAREMRRVAVEPALMGYTAGAGRLLDLREEIRGRLGQRFRIRDFNDAVLRCGASPVGVVRACVRRAAILAEGGAPFGAKR